MHASWIGNVQFYFMGSLDIAGSHTDCCCVVIYIYGADCKGTTLLPSLIF